MTGTIEGGRRAAKANKERYGEDFYRKIGSKGGQTISSKPRGFAANIELARIAGAKGGKISKRSTDAKKEKEYIWRPGDEFVSE